MPPRLLVIAVLACCGACSRSAVASMLPALQVQARAQRRSGVRQARSTGAWDYQLFLRLSFQRRWSATDLPGAFDQSPALFGLSCEEDDAACLEEAALMEPALLGMLREIP